MAVKATTPERILDSAEALFAEGGFDAVSVRAITDRAGVRLNLLSYHFKSKEGLFEAVIDRRLHVLNARRREILAAAEADGSVLGVARLLTIFIRPYIDLAVTGGEGWKSYTRIIAQICQSDRFSPLLKLHMEDTLTIFLDRFARSLPDVDRDRLVQAFYFTIALMVSSFAGVGRIEALAQPGLDATGLDAALEPLIAYTTAGFLAACGIRSAA
ncbi:TetR/AcrR family transcriptional regulator [Oryzibacter oryziterrae]|uniref:TetR/AcrR family transcriptional regulator n=1 Tax=Oryzibacter oryziterrae TaxID=2766474 RepID=UPI001F02BD0A|nr:TetR/AcrR family transcriptional regulator [Oryzibacter oryziterrae]